jgi:hypothetical protein
MRRARSKTPSQVTAKIRCHALAIYFMHYNYVRIHTSLRVTPAMAAGVSKTLWSVDDVVKVVEAWEAANDGIKATSE